MYGGVKMRLHILNLDCRWKSVSRPGHFTLETQLRQPLGIGPSRPPEAVWITLQWLKNPVLFSNGTSSPNPYSVIYWLSYTGLLLISDWSLVVPNRSEKNTERQSGLWNREPGKVPCNAVSFTYTILTAQCSSGKTHQANTKAPMHAKSNGNKGEEICNNCHFRRRWPLWMAWEFPKWEFYNKPLPQTKSM